MLNKRKAKNTRDLILIILILINVSIINIWDSREVISAETSKKVGYLTNNKDEIEYFQMLRTNTFVRMASLELKIHAKVEGDILYNKISKEPTIVEKTATIKKKSKKKDINKKTKKKVIDNKSKAKVAKSVNNQGYSNNVINSISNADISMLERIVEAEATAGNIESKTHIASVILNRLISDKFPNSIEGVIFQRNGKVVQFSPIKDGRYYSVIVTKDTKEAVQEVLKNGDTTKGALYFCNPSDIKTKWFNSLNKLFTDEIGHTFFN